MAAIPPIPPVPIIPTDQQAPAMVQQAPVMVPTLPVMVEQPIYQDSGIPGIPPFPVTPDISEEIAECTLPDVEAQQSAEAASNSDSIANLVARLANTNDKPKRASTRRSTETSDSEENGNGLTPSGRVRQNRRSRKQVDEDRLYDGTQLHASHHGYFVHRDYAAHFFRWSAVINRMKPGMRILDVGAGQDLPLPRVISAPNVFKNVEPEQVVCVDWNPLSESFNPKWLQKIGEFDFCKRYPELIGSITQDGSFVQMDQYKFDLVSCLEVIEHMDQNSGDELLQGIRACLKDDGKLCISTPVFNGSAAANHIYEYTAEELYNKLTDNGFLIMERFGTFANLVDLRKVMTEQERDLERELGKFYNNDVISCFFAPKFPDASRNNFWVCMKNPDWVPSEKIPAQAYAIPDVINQVPVTVTVPNVDQASVPVIAPVPPAPAVPYQGQGTLIYSGQGVLVGEAQVEHITSTPAIPVVPAVPAIPEIP